jgi:hypothetical protein
MSTSGCLVVAVDLDRHAENTIRRAASVARFSRLALVVVHVVEHDTGCEADHVPFLAPQELRARMARQARAWLLGVVHHLGLKDAEIVAVPGNLPATLADVAAEHRARYLVTGPLRWGALSRLAALSRHARLVATHCEILHLGRDRDVPRPAATHWVNRWS